MSRGEHQGEEIQLIPPQDTSHSPMPPIQARGKPRWRPAGQISRVRGHTPPRCSADRPKSPGLSPNGAPGPWGRGWWGSQVGMVRVVNDRRCPQPPKWVLGWVSSASPWGSGHLQGGSSCLEGAQHISKGVQDVSKGVQHVLKELSMS